MKYFLYLCGRMIYNLITSLPMVVCLFWGITFFFRCFRHSDEPRAQRNILLFFIVATILYFDHWLYFSGKVYTAGEWSYGVANLCVYPLYYAYLRALTRAKKNWEVPLLLIPAVMAIFLFPIGRYTRLLTDADTFLIIRICFMVQVIWVLVRGYWLLLYTVRHMDNTYSDDRSRILRPTHLWLVLFGITAVISMVLNIIGRAFFTHETSVILPAIFMSVLLYGLGYIAAHTTVPAETVTEEPIAEYSVSEEETAELIKKIDTLMREKMLYKNAGLTIQDLATAVNSNRTYVSKAINCTYHISFSQYVSQQRVAYAQLILRDPERGPQWACHHSPR